MSFQSAKHYQATKSLLWAAAQPETDRNGYADFDFDTLLDIHDGFVESDNYAAADRVKAEISARPEYPAHQALLARLAQEFQSAQPEESDAPF